MNTETMLSSLERYYGPTFDGLTRQLIADRAGRWSDAERAAIFGRIVETLPRRYKRLPDLAEIVEAHNLTALPSMRTVPPLVRGREHLNEEESRAGMKKILAMFANRRTA